MNDPIISKKHRKTVKRDATYQWLNAGVYLTDIQEKAKHPDADLNELNAIVEKCYPTTLGMLQ
jgi:hypothetical protein